MAQRKTQQQGGSTREVVERLRENVQMLKALRRISDVDLAKKAAFTSRQTMNARLIGRTGFEDQEIADIAAALGVEPHLLWMPAEDVLMWVQQHPEYVPPKVTTKRPGRKTAKA